MSTRSTIAILLPDGKVRCIYVHYDGYLSHHAPILLGHYKTYAQVETLISLGNLSALGEQLGVQHPFDSEEHITRKWCDAYGRDRGESEQEAAEVADVEAFKDWYQEYNYLFKDDEWFVLGGDHHNWTPLSTAWAKERLTA